MPRPKSEKTLAKEVAALTAKEAEGKVDSLDVANALGATGSIEVTDNDVAVPPEEVKSSPWQTLETISDDIVTVQAVAITGHQKRGCLIRCIVGGEVIGDVKFLQNFIPKIFDGTWQLR